MMNEARTPGTRGLWLGRKTIPVIATSSVGLVSAAVAFGLHAINATQCLSAFAILVLPIPAFALFRRAGKHQNRNTQRVDSIVSFASSLSTGGDAFENLSEFLTSAAREVGADGGYVMLADELDSDLLRLEAAFSTDPAVSYPPELRMGEGLTGYVFERNQPITVHQNSDGTHLDLGRITTKDRSAICVPIASKPLLISGNDQTTQTLGTLTVVGKSFERDDMPFLVSVASLISVAVAKTRIEGKQITGFKSTIQRMATAFEARDEYTRGHSERVCKLSMMLAESLHFGSEDLKEIRIGTILHDIGKIGVPDAIINKKGRLTDEEFAIMKTYPVIGFELCSSLMLGEGALMIVRNHHERLDGSGYPDGLKGGEIPPMLRVVCVADVFDSMSSARPYRGVMEVDEVFAELSREAGVLFDPIVVEALRNLLPSPKFQELYVPVQTPTLALRPEVGAA